MNLTDIHRTGVGDDASAGIWVTDRDGRTTFANAKLARMLGLTAEEMVGRSIYGFLFIDDVPMAIEARENLTAGVVEFRHARFRHAAGSEVWASLVVASMTDPDGRLVGTVSIFSDITEQHRIAEALRRSEERFRLALSGSRTVICTQDRDLRFTWIHNPAFDLERYGDPIGRTDVEVLGAQEGGPYMVIKRRVMETGAGEHVVAPLTFHGETRWFDSTIDPTRDASGAVDGVVVVTVDITDLKSTELALRESESRFRLLADSAAVMIWVIDARGEVDFVNRPWLEFVGGDVDGGHLEVWRSRIHPEDRDIVERGLAESAQRRPVECEYRVRRHDGVYRWLLDIDRPRWSPKGEYLGFTATLVDVTERREAEQARRS